jgi:thiol-disulfide isomerase/thioredoxin
MYKTLGELSGGPKKSQQENYTQVPEVSSIDDKKALIANNKLVVLYIFGSWCAPCIAMAPVYAKLYDKYKDLCIIVKENVELRLSPSVTVVPTFLIYIDGTLKHQIVNDIDAVEKVIKTTLML